MTCAHEQLPCYGAQGLEYPAAELFALRVSSARGVDYHAQDLSLQQCKRSWTRVHLSGAHCLGSSTSNL